MRVVLKVQSIGQSVVMTIAKAAIYDILSDFLRACLVRQHTRVAIKPLAHALIYQGRHATNRSSDA